MQERVSVNEAIARGHRMINVPVMGIMFGTLGLCLYTGIQKILPIWIIPIGFLLAFGLAWLYWSIMITKWRLWAFEQVRNVHELKKRAVLEKLIWPDNSVFEKTEIRSTIDKERWDMLQHKFEKEDEFIDDSTIPSETNIYFSKGKNYFEMAIMLGCLLVGLYLLTKENDPIFGSILSLMGAYFAYKEFQKTSNMDPQVVINDKGIKTVSTEFYQWEEVKNEEVISEGSGKYIRHYLVYDYPEGSEYLQIDDLDVNQQSLSQLLVLYRGRSRKNNTF